MSNWQYRYNVKVLKVVDGDTIDVMVDLGMNVFRKERLRLYKIDAWETRGEERPWGLEAKEALKDLLDSKDVYIESYKDKTGKYGRFLATVFVKDGATTINVNEWLVDNGHAEFAEY